MKKDIHPKYFQTTVACACGNVIQTGSTVENLHTEICSHCHPFYTGKQKLVDTAHRVDRFKRRQEKAQDLTVKKLKRMAKTKPTKVKAKEKAKTEVQ